MLLACGDGQAGFALHVADRRLVHTYHHGRSTSVVSSGVLGRRARMLTATVATGGGTEARVELLAGGRLVGRGRIERIAHARLSYAGLDVGLDRGVGVGDYAAPFAFTGAIRRVVVTTRRTSPADVAGALAVELATG